MTHTASMQVDWAHLDIAPTAWSMEKHHATGYGVMLLSRWAASYGKD